MQHIFITDSDYANTDSGFQYLLGFQPSLGAMILSESRLLVLLDARYFGKTFNINIQHIKNILQSPDLEVIFVKIQDLTESIIFELQGETKIVLEDNIALVYYKRISKALTESDISFSSGYFSDIKILKSEDEKTCIKKAISIIDDVFLYIQSISYSGDILGKTELELRQLIIKKIFELGGEGESFESIVAFGKNSAVPHHLSGDTVIENGVLLIDMGAKYKGYCSDFTRTIWVGEKTIMYDKFIKAHGIVERAHNKAIEKYTSGMSGGEVDTLARDVIQDSQYKDLFIHSLGHGLGLDIHEEPRLKKGNETELLEGMVFTIEPGIYIEDQFGIRLEDIVFLENKKLVKYTQIHL